VAPCRREIFADGRQDCSEFAESLGIALQLTNIVRDVGDDARRGRIYLPIEDLRRFEVPAHEILKASDSERFVALMRFQAQRARGFLRAGVRGAAGCGAARSAGADHGRDLRDAARRDRTRRVPGASPRVALTPVRKLWIAWRT